MTQSGRPTDDDGGSAVQLGAPTRGQVTEHRGAHEGVRRRRWRIRCPRRPAGRRRTRRPWATASSRWRRGSSSPARSPRARNAIGSPRTATAVSSASTAGTHPPSRDEHERGERPGRGKLTGSRHGADRQLVEQGLDVERVAPCVGEQPIRRRHADGRTAPRLGELSDMGSFEGIEPEVRALVVDQPYQAVRQVRQASLRTATHRTTGSRRSRRAAKVSARRDGRSAHWASSTTTTRGRAGSISRLSTRTHEGGTGPQRIAPEGGQEIAALIGREWRRPHELVDDAVVHVDLGLVAAGPHDHGRIVAQRSAQERWSSPCPPRPR